MAGTPVTGGRGAVSRPGKTRQKIPFSPLARGPCSTGRRRVRRAGGADVRLDRTTTKIGMSAIRSRSEARAWKSFSKSGLKFSRSAFIGPREGKIISPRSVLSRGAAGLEKFFPNLDPKFSAWLRTMNTRQHYEKQETWRRRVRVHGALRLLWPDGMEAWSSARSIWARRLAIATMRLVCGAVCRWPRGGWQKRGGPRRRSRSHANSVGRLEHCPIRLRGSARRCSEACRFRKALARRCSILQAQPSHSSSVTHVRAACGVRNRGGITRLPIVRIHERRAGSRLGLTRFGGHPEAFARGAADAKEHAHRIRRNFADRWSTWSMLAVILTILPASLSRVATPSRAWVSQADRNEGRREEGSGPPV